MAKNLTRHQQSLENATALVEEIRQLTKRLPEEEDMVMVPAMREAVMTLHKAVMMLAVGDCSEESFYDYTDEIFGKLEALRTYLCMCLSLNYIDEETFSGFENRLIAIGDPIFLPKKPQLTVVK